MGLIVPIHLGKLIIQTILFLFFLIKLDEIFQNYFKESLIADVIGKNISLINSETKKQHSQCGEI